MADSGTPMELDLALTSFTRGLCLGREHGQPGLVDVVTPTTADLLKWWFGGVACRSRAFNFHSGQQQAILNTIVAHEVLGRTGLARLNRAPDRGNDGFGPAAGGMPEGGEARYGLCMPAGTGRAWVVRALVVWQSLNWLAADEQGRADPRFVDRFLLLAPDRYALRRLLDAWFGPMSREDPGRRESRLSDTHLYRKLFVPPAWRRRLGALIDVGGALETVELPRRPGLWIALLDADAEDVAAPGDDRGPAPPVSPQRPGSMVVHDAAYAVGRVDEQPADQRLRIVERLHRGASAGNVWLDLLAIAAATSQRLPWRSTSVLLNLDCSAAAAADLVKHPVLDDVGPPAWVPMREPIAERTAAGYCGLYESQHDLLLHALERLHALTTAFAEVGGERSPGLLVACEDRRLLPDLADFFARQGLPDEDVLVLDEGADPWLHRAGSAPGRDCARASALARPKVVVLVAGPRPPIDVDHLCIAVPLPASPTSTMPLEWFVAAGLPTMWRDRGAIAELKRADRRRMGRGQAPTSLMDLLLILGPEHRWRQSGCRSLPRLEAKAAEPGSSALGDLIPCPLREDVDRYDFPVPSIVGDSAMAADESAAPRGLRFPPLLLVRRSSSLAVAKSPYPRLPYTSGLDGFDHRFLAWAEADSMIEAYCPVNRPGWSLPRFDIDALGMGLSASGPQYLVRTGEYIYLLKVDAATSDRAERHRHRLATAAWCERVNQWPAEQRGYRQWRHAVLGTGLLDQWRADGGRLTALLKHRSVLARSGTFAGNDFTAPRSSRPMVRPVPKLGLVRI